MAIDEVKLPDIGEGVTEGELVKWLVKPGDKVVPDQPIAEVMTDKATVEVPTPVAGTVKELKFKAGDVIPIETVILTLEGGAAARVTETPSPAARMPAPTPARKTNGASVGGLEVYPPAAEQRVLATPSTRRLAREMNVDINNLSGTGLAGRVTREDVLKRDGGGLSAKGPALPSRTPMAPKPRIAGEREVREPLRGVRKKIAENLQMAKRIIPHFTHADEANVTALVELRTQAKAAAEKSGVKVTFLPFVMKALIATLREFPQMNASIDDESQEIVTKHYYNIGFAADTPNGLLVPNVKDADQKTVLELAAEIQTLAGKARDGKLSLEEMKHATITITNIGSVGGIFATPIINHPEVAILGMYKIVDRPIWENGTWKPAKMMNFTITCDHRLVDGAVAANFMKAFLARIENPSQLILDMM
jgi:pyruvate dehydrogenase E2 component (dihydrolipoamide acetyltransferase)